MIESRLPSSILITILFIICAWSVTVCFSASDSIDEILRTLENSFAGITTVQTGFTQEKELALFEQKITLTGRIVLENPGRLA
ncbi:MAG: hypothetical protein JXN60_00700, partial [Lentisphaerae bacterium]|nr:hypothetical protein [Lentisphaerota bacterium]